MGDNMLIRMISGCHQHVAFEPFAVCCDCVGLFQALPIAHSDDRIVLMGIQRSLASVFKNNIVKFRHRSFLRDARFIF